VPERDGYQAGVPCWVDTSQPDPEGAAAFYGGLLGWDLEDQMPPEAPGHYFMATLRGRQVAAIGSIPPGAPPEAMWTTYVWVDDVDGAAARVSEAGGAVHAGPFDVFDAGRMAAISDPAGAAFCLWQPGRHRGAQVVNEPGSWNWSNLSSTDPKGAEAFYGAVFGWRADQIDMGEGPYTLWRVPGYEAIHGAPGGFEDVVAGMRQAPPGEGARWAVSFVVDDADAAAGRARELGGSVVEEPFEVTFSRLAVVADPAGATFTVSTLRSA
jgi:predicted enzyme related to lactoylglutathione lyase